MTASGTLRRSLEGRRATIAEVLAALQRIGRNPPPALMVRPEDALQSVRTAIMLGAVVPEMRVQAEALAADLADLARVRSEIAEEKVRLLHDVAAETEDRQRVARLIEERQSKQADTEKVLEAERQKSIVLARQVDNLKDLIGKVEQGLDSASRAARSAARSVEDKAKESRVDLAALSDPGRLAPARLIHRRPRTFAASGERGEDQGVRGARQPRRNREGIDPGHPGVGPGHVTVRWMGGLCRTLPQLRPSLDP